MGERTNLNCIEEGKRENYLLLLVTNSGLSPVNSELIREAEGKEMLAVTTAPVSNARSGHSVALAKHTVPCPDWSKAGLSSSIFPSGLLPK